MLCSLEPVRCWSRFPNWSGSTIRRSTRTPVWVRSRTPASPGVAAASTRSSSVAARDSAPGSDAVAITSRSLTVSVMRRADPASSTRSAAGWARSAATSGSPIASARSSKIRERGSAAPDSSTAARIDSSALGPKPFSVLICCCSAALRSASGESIPSSSNSLRARLGPMPGRWVITIRPGGNLARSLTAAGIAPSAASASTFS